MEAYFAFIVHPQSGDVLTDNNNRLPTVLHGDPAFDLNKLCTSVQNVINDVYSLILLRTECEVLAGRAHQDQSTVIPKYVNKLLIFEIVSEDLVSAPKGFTWLPKEKCSSVVVDPKVLSVCEFTKKYETLGLLVNWDRLHPFSRPGWFEEVASWIRTRAFFHNLCINDIQQASRRDNGCVLRATSSCGSVLYFKQVGPNVFFDEVRNSMLLSTFMSNYFTRPIEVDTDRKWILRKDQGTPFSVASCSMKTNPDLFQRVLRKWGTIQQQSIPLTDKLVESGMDLMDSAKLHVAMEELVSDAGWCSVLAEELASAGDAVGLDYVKANKLLLAQTRRLWDRAAMYNIPMALVHGDLSPANVMIDEGDEVSFIDFGSTCVSMPLRDAVSLASSCGAKEDDLQHYFEMWTEYESVDRTKELYRVLCSLKRLDSARVLYKQYLTAEQSQRVCSLSNLRTCIRFLLKWLRTCL
eukprot:gb/GEZJ01002767.1/.p1 GENE.gb/GEZJ01002767.1/~~gb/GEZJ01002767.1/.p1  ORF type:complete len:466 (-),score=55.87 gb/GEZJ01002767.1/:615-2012(-)